MAALVCIFTPSAPRHSGRALGLIQMLALAQAYWHLIRGANKWLAITLCLFFCGLAGAVVLGVANPNLNDHLADQLHGNPETGFPAFILCVKHNVTAMLILWCGSLVLGLVPLLGSLGTGLVLGILLVDRGVIYGFLSIFPHAIVEWTAFLLSSAFFLRLGLRWVFQKNATDRKRTFIADFRDSLKIAFLCAGLLCVAAAIETFGTPKIQAGYERGHLAGIGVQLAEHEHQLTISQVIPDRPASKAGLVCGLVIHKIDGVETAGKNLRQIREMVHGRVGTKVRLELIDPARNQTNTIELVRDLPPL